VCSMLELEKHRGQHRILFWLRLSRAAKLSWKARWLATPFQEYIIGGGVRLWPGVHLHRGDWEVREPLYDFGFQILD